MIFRDFIDTPVGILEICASEAGITSIAPSNEKTEIHASPIILQAQNELMAYFAGELKTFDVPLDYSHGTAFFRSVWKIVYEIPYGTTVSYLDIALKLNNTGAIRAVGMANARNTIPIIIPCHRVIGSNGSLTGYAWGLDVKKKLLMLENPQVFGLQGSLAL